MPALQVVRQMNGKREKRAEVLFEVYPDLKETYSLKHSLRMILSKNNIQDSAKLSLARRLDKL